MGFKVGKDTIFDYLSYLQEAYSVYSTNSEKISQSKLIRFRHYKLTNSYFTVSFA